MSTLSSIRDTVLALCSLALQRLFAGSRNQVVYQRTQVSSISSSSISSLSSISSMSSDEGVGEDPRPYSTNASRLRMQLALDILDATTRTLHTRRWEETNVAKCSQLPLVLGYFKRYDIIRFRRNLRVNPTTFDMLCHELQHPVFTNNSTASQLPYQYQIAIALYRFGHEGNGVSCEGTAQWAGIAVGTVIKVTFRVIEAILSKHNQVIRWASEEEKEEAKRWVEHTSGCTTWRDGYCMVDGTLIPLFAKPAFFGEAYFDRKSNYSLNAQLVTLPNLRIIDYVVGHCGSAHDSTAFKDSRAVQEKTRLFNKQEWIWADSAYTSQTWVVTPYKRPWSLQTENRIFNYHVSKVRVRSEHAVGFLKGRFASLKGLRLRIEDADGHIIALSWIKACIVLHTLIFWIEKGHEDWTEQEELILEGEEEEDSDNEYEEGPIRVQAIPSNRTLHEVLSESTLPKTPAQQKRTAVKQALLHKLHG